MMRPSQLSVICWIAASSIQTSGKGATVKTGRGSFQVRFAPGDGAGAGALQLPASRPHRQDGRGRTQSQTRTLCILIVTVGEFHLGALDRGTPHTGLRSAVNQEQRGDAYRYFVSTALRHPAIVGVSWFQLYDQAFTGLSEKLHQGKK